MRAMKDETLASPSLDSSGTTKPVCHSWVTHEDACNPSDMSDSQTLDPESDRPDEFDGVCILLATRNGGPYLAQQLESIARQSFTRWCLFVGDDGSSDDTREIIAHFADTHPGRVELLNAAPVGSASANFFRLLRRAPRARYYAFCDQDDVWADQKLERLLQECQYLEHAQGADHPCLVYSDLTVVDENLVLMAPSFLRQIRAMPSRVSFRSLLVENLAPGCAMLMNASLVTVFRSWPGPLDDAIMHDWWLALLSEGTGSLLYVDESLVQYRQHAHNALGTVQRSGATFVLRKLFSSPDDSVPGPVHQARLFRRAYGSLLVSEKDARALAVFSGIDRRNKVSRITACLREGILKQTWPRRLYQLLRV